MQARTGLRDQGHVETKPGADRSVNRGKSNRTSAVKPDVSDLDTHTFSHQGEKEKSSRPHCHVPPGDSPISMMTRTDDPTAGAGGRRRRACPDAILGVFLRVHDPERLVDGDERRSWAGWGGWEGHSCSSPAGNRKSTWDCASSFRRFGEVSFFAFGMQRRLLQVGWRSLVRSFGSVALWTI